VAYKIIAERENETITIKRLSSLATAANAKVWASEGWQVVIVDGDGRTYAPDEKGGLMLDGHNIITR